jgi:type II secretory pathway pseudopilin PulG
MLLVLVIIAMITSIAVISFSAMSDKSYFRKRASTLVQAFQSAYSAAQQSDRRYAVVLSFSDGVWVLRQFNRLDFEGIPEEEAIIKTGIFNDRFYLDYVYYDDQDDTRFPKDGQMVTEARFYAGHGGWQHGGKVVLRDEDGNPWSILIYRAGKPVELVQGDVAMFLPLEPGQMPF